MHDTATSLTGVPISKVAVRSLKVFAFTFCVIMVLGIVYNELVISDSVIGLTVDQLPREDPSVPDPEYTPLRFSTHQVVSMAIAAGGVMVLVRMVLEALCAYAGRETCQTLTGQYHPREEANEVVDDDFDSEVVPMSIDEESPELARHEAVPRPPERNHDYRESLRRRKRQR